MNGIAVIVAIACLGESRVAARQADCSTDATEFAQITTMRLDAGQQTFEAFRILRTAGVEWARWDSSGYLLDHAQIHGESGAVYDRVLSSPSFANHPEPSADGGALGRPAFRLELATFSPSGIRVVSLGKMPDDLAGLTEDIRRRLAPTPVETGWYVWTKPYPAGSHPDVALADAGCGTAVEKALSVAIATGSLIVRADSGIRAYVSGERTSRSEFSASIAEGGLRFGILFAK